MKRLIPLFLTAIVPLAAADTPLLGNGDFESAKDGKPDGWSLPAGVSYETEGANHFLRLTGAGTSTQISVFREFPANGAKAITVAYKVRYAEVKRGGQPWHDARIIMEAKNAEKAAIKGALPHPFFTGSSAGWVEKSFSRVLPEGTATITFMPALFMVESGTFDIDDVVITAIDPAAVPAK
jgi:hypothetical protein